MDQKWKDNLTKLEGKTDSMLVRIGNFFIRLADYSYTVGIIAIVILIVLVAWVAWR